MNIFVYMNMAHKTMNFDLIHDIKFEVNLHYFSFLHDILWSTIETLRLHVTPNVCLPLL